MQLSQLLEAAQGAAPDRRILFRDQIAPYGTAAIEGVQPWLTSEVLAAFAVRVILRVGQQGESVAAAKALRAARRRVPARVLGDVDWALAALRLAAREAVETERALAMPAVSPAAPAVFVQSSHSLAARRRR